MYKNHNITMTLDQKKIVDDVLKNVIAKDTNHAIESIGLASYCVQDNTAIPGRFDFLLILPPDKHLSEELDDYLARIDYAIIKEDFHKYYIGVDYISSDMAPHYKLWEKDQ